MIEQILVPPEPIERAKAVSEFAHANGYELKEESAKSETVTYTFDVESFCEHLGHIEQTMTNESLLRVRRKPYRVVELMRVTTQGDFLHDKIVTALPDIKAFIKPDKVSFKITDNIRNEIKS